MNMFDQFVNAANSIFKSAIDDERMFQNPNPERLRKMTLEEPGVRETVYGNLVVPTEPASRAKPFTKNNIDDAFDQPELNLLEQAKARFSKARVICLDVLVRQEDSPVTARLMVPRRFAHLAYGGLKLFGPALNNVQTPTYQVIFFDDEAFAGNADKPLPEKDITIRLAFSDDGRMVKFVRNSSYLGEWKKGIFAGEDYRAKKSGAGIFLHAGCRSDTMEMVSGDMRTQNSLFVALSANGKTSLTCKVLASKAGEESWLVQDDGGILRRDGSFSGFEQGGIYAKTDGLSPSEQIETYYASLKPGAYLENVHVDDTGRLDFFNIERTSNGRAVLRRDDFMHCCPSIDTDKVDNLFLITRGNTVPAVSRLTPHQATAFMVLGQSMESSAGDPTQAGKIKNVFFYDPFLAGDRVAHAHLFHSILRANPHINCYLLNTGGVGEGEHHHKIGLADTVSILDAILRGDVSEWVEHEATGLSVPKAMAGVDSLLFHPDRLFARHDFEARQQALYAKRREILLSYPGLDPEVAAAIKK